jgi:2-oxoglutarate dehydrogenase E1 component
MYIRTPERIKWIQNYLNDNDNKPQLSDDQRNHILKNLFKRIILKAFCIKSMLVKRDFHWREEKL